MKKAIRLCILMIVFILILTACGGVMEQKETGINNSEYNWKTDGFVPENGLGENLLFNTEYRKIEYTEPEELLGKNLCQVSYNDEFYILDSFYTNQGTIYNFQILNIEGEVQFESELATSQWGIEKGSVLGMNVIDMEQLVFWVASDFGENVEGQWEAGHYYAVYTDKQCGMLKSVDLTETLRTQGIWESAPSKYGGTDIDCDSQGNLYLRDNERHIIFLIDNEGKYKSQYSYPTGEECYISCFRSDSGDVIFSCHENGGIRYIWLNSEDGQFRGVFTADEKYIQKWYGLYDNLLVYALDNELFGWNISSGAVKKLLRFQEYEIKDVTGVVLLKTANGIRLLVSENNKRYILGFSEEEPSVNANLTFANICGDNSFLKGRIVSFSRENPSFAVDYQEVYQTEEDINRILMETVSGKGPDILYVSRENMKNLVKNDALGILSQIISEENRNVMLPGALEMGSEEGELLGMPLSVYINTLITNRLYWKEDTWTVNDVLKILDEHEELLGLFVDVFGQDDYFYNMYYMIGMDLENSQFMVNGESHFDCEEFQNVLIRIKEKTGNIETGGSLANMVETLNTGTILGMGGAIFGMRDYGSVCQKIGENTRIVGYPTESGCGNYMTANGMLVVNKNAVDKAGVKELVNYLFELETQMMIQDGISVRLDVPEKQLKYDSNRKNYYLLYPDESMQYLPDKYDKSSYLDEYLHFIENAVPRALDSDELFYIVMEEADNYFYSDKVVSEVTKTIQNRVQLYLDEKK